jgi:hypothetical protein
MSVPSGTFSELFVKFMSNGTDGAAKMGDLISDLSDFQGLTKGLAIAYRKGERLTWGDQASRGGLM